jgi:hypothetical protein
MEHPFEPFDLVFEGSGAEVRASAMATGLAAFRNKLTVHLPSETIGNQVTP